MSKYAIFGAGEYGKELAELIGLDNIEVFIDNDINKQGTFCLKKKIVSLNDAMKSDDEYVYVVAVSDKYMNDICHQLQSAGIEKYSVYNDIKIKLTKDKILSRPDYISIYKKAISWIYANTVNEKGIINNSKLKEAYPEVTGYYIPTLIRWGYKELALGYAKWLCSIQHDDGSWYDTMGKEPYIFDTAQILKGLIAIYNFDKNVELNIRRGCDWIISCMSSNGKLVTPSTEEWGKDGSCSDLIHTYCISPIIEAGKIFKCERYLEAANKMVNYYITERRNEILNFNLLSHFYAYVMEAMIDIGHSELAEEAMNKIAVLQKDSGAVPAYNNVDWVCSTGIFQMAIVWFRLGNIERGNRAFEYACKLQNESGGWYGSYVSEDNANEINTYFPAGEISWAVKYFLDALYYKNLALFNKQASMFYDHIKADDGRYVCIKNAVASVQNGGRILDVGCGKGRYIKNLLVEYPDNKYYAVDVSLSVLKYIDLDDVEKTQGMLTDIPYPDDYFDLVYTCEALEHSVDISSAIAEMCRVAKRGGKVVIVDKSIDMLGFFEIEEWEQWLDDVILQKELLKHCSNVEIIKDVNYDNHNANGLFHCWIGTIGGK